MKKIILVAYSAIVGIVLTNPARADVPCSTIMNDLYNWMQNSDPNVVHEVVAQVVFNRKDASWASYAKVKLSPYSSSTRVGSTWGLSGSGSSYFSNRCDLHTYYDTCVQPFGKNYTEQINIDFGIGGTFARALIVNNQSPRVHCEVGAMITDFRDIVGVITFNKTSHPAPPR